MAIVAGGDGTMAGIDPTIEVVLHDVAVGAGIGIVPEIGRTLGIDERVTPEARRRAEREGDHDREHDRHLGLRS